MSDFSKILVIEDEPRLAQMLKRGLNENDFIADNAFDGQEGFDMFKNVYHRIEEFEKESDLLKNLN